MARNRFLKFYNISVFKFVKWHLWISVYVYVCVCLVATIFSLFKDRYFCAWNINLTCGSVLVFIRFSYEFRYNIMLNFRYMTLSLLELCSPGRDDKMIIMMTTFWFATHIATFSIYITLWNILHKMLLFWFKYNFTAIASLSTSPGALSISPENVHRQWECGNAASNSNNILWVNN